MYTPMVSKSIKSVHLAASSKGGRDDDDDDFMPSKWAQNKSKGKNVESSKGKNVASSKGIADDYSSLEEFMPGKLVACPMRYDLCERE
jgi:hypothetical protein